MKNEPEHEITGTAPPSLPTTARIILRVNGAEKQVDVAPWTTLLDALREYLHLTGTKKGCDQ
jgi:xanthine dehydrogenase YagT iron-sulfur-binding subunit